jgi:hypothetical protein
MCSKCPSPQAWFLEPKLNNKSLWQTENSLLRKCREQQTPPKTNIGMILVLPQGKLKNPTKNGLPCKDTNAGSNKCRRKGWDKKMF